MPENSTHPAYDAMHPEWRLIRDVLGGDAAIKTNAGSYIPRLHDQKDADFRSYVRRGNFFNAPSRALTAWRGMIFRKEAIMDTGAIPETSLEDIDLLGNSAADYVEAVTGETLSIGRSVTVIDWNQEENRPYLVRYPTESVINWRMARIGGRTRLSLLVLHETIIDDSEDEFEPETIDQWRIYRVQGEGAMVTVTVIREMEDKGLEVVEYRPLSRRGVSLPDIPAIFHGPDTKAGCEICPPPLIDIAKTAISHFGNSIDLENGRHIAGLPTPWAAGFVTADDEKLVLGMSNAWVSDDPSAKCGFLEFSGQGLSVLENALLEKERHMAALGARSIQPEKEDAEAFETVKMRATAETASLVSIANAVSKTTTQALRWFAWWIGAKSHPDVLTEIEVRINTDLVAAKINPQMLTALTQAYVAGSISFETYFYNLQGGEVYEDQTDAEEERARILASAVPPAPDPPAQAPPSE